MYSKEACTSRSSSVRTVNVKARTARTSPCGLIHIPIGSCIVLEESLGNVPFYMQNGLHYLSLPPRVIAPSYLVEVLLQATQGTATA